MSSTIKTRNRKPKYERAAKVIKLTNGIFKVESFSKRGVFHRVRRTNGGGWTCGCGAWIYQRDRLQDGKCHHIRRALAA